MRLLRIIRTHWNLFRCQRKHREHHQDVQCELVRIGCAERTMGNGELVPATPHLWRLWTGCDKCGCGWCHTVEQEVDGTPGTPRNEPLPMIPDATFHTPGGRNPRESH